ncbi:hypothetical protein EDE12_12911 [Methylosinus sp. sav-2]|nr:hypothetical protein EDE12_12911 [Methylosinus sp. sav-2]
MVARRLDLPAILETQETDGREVHCLAPSYGDRVLTPAEICDLVGF